MLPTVQGTLMTNPFTPPGGFTQPFGGLSFIPLDRHVLQDQWRQARRAHREFREQVREHLRQHDAGSGGSGGRGFGAIPVINLGLDPRAGFGMAGGRRRGRGRRGDVRSAILKLLAERPMHGYEMIQEIADRTANLWRPSPGSVYPTLQLLVDEGLIAATESDGSKKLFELTDEGRAAADKIETPPWEEIADSVEPGHANLQSAVAQLTGAVAQSSYAADEEQQQRIVEIINNARRDIYGILGESE